MKRVGKPFQYLPNTVRTAIRTCFALSPLRASAVGMAVLIMGYCTATAAANDNGTSGASSRQNTHGTGGNPDPVESVIVELGYGPSIIGTNKQTTGEVHAESPTDREKHSENRPPLSQKSAQSPQRPADNFGAGTVQSFSSAIERGARTSVELAESAGSSLWTALKKTGGFLKRTAESAADKVDIPYFGTEREHSIERWEDIAAQFARKTVSLQEKRPLLFEQPVFVNKKEKTAFETLYHELITTKLLDRGLCVSTDRGEQGFTVSYHTKLLRDTVLITTELSDNGRLLVQTARRVAVTNLKDRRYYVENMLMDPTTEKSYKRFKLVDKD